MTGELPRWSRILLVLLAIAMAAVLLVQGIGRWAFNRGIPTVLEMSGSQDADGYAKQGQRLFELGQYKVAEQYARTALKRSPMHQKALRTLGMAQVAQGKEAEGRRTMQAAGRLGWQDVATQTWLMWDALQLGQPGAALLRADALARRGTMATGLFKVFVTFGSEPRTRALLLRRLEKASEWRPDFFRFSTAATLAEAETAERLLRELKRGSAPPAREEVVPIVRRLAALGAFERAANLSSDLLGEPRANAADAIGDGDFKRFDIYGDRAVYRTPFDWEFGTTPGATAVVEQPDQPGDGALYVEANGARKAMLANKVVRIPPGPHLLSFTIRSPEKKALARFQWTVTCLSNGQQLLGDVTGFEISNQPTRRSLPFTVPAGCPFQQLQLAALEAPERQAVSAYFDDVAVR